MPSGSRKVQVSLSSKAWRGSGNGGRHGWLEAVSLDTSTMQPFRKAQSMQAGEGSPRGWKEGAAWKNGKLAHARRTRTITIKS